MNVRKAENKWTEGSVSTKIKSEHVRRERERESDIWHLLRLEGCVGREASEIHFTWRTIKGKPVSVHPWWGRLEPWLVYHREPCNTVPIFEGWGAQWRVCRDILAGVPGHLVWERKIGKSICSKRPLSLLWEVVFSKENPESPPPMIHWTTEPSAKVKYSPAEPMCNIYLFPVALPWPQCHPPAPQHPGRRGTLKQVIIP